MSEADIPGLRGRGDSRWALLFLAPNLAGFLIFVALPVGFSLVMAFTNWDLIERAPFQFVGLDNFRRMLFDRGSNEFREFWKFLVNTLYLMLGLPVSVAGSLFLAVLLSEPLRCGSPRARLLLLSGAALVAGGGVVVCTLAGGATVGLILAITGGTAMIAIAFNRVGLRTLFYLPFFTTGVAQYILWKLMFRPDIGPINNVIRAVADAGGALFDGVGKLLGRGWGLGAIAEWFHAVAASPPEWLGSTANLLMLDPQTGLPGGGEFGLGARDAIVIMGVWATVGGNNLLLYLAGLANVPQDLYEAAMIDGAGRWRTFWSVSWPQLAPTTFFIVIMSIIGGLQGGFEQARVMTEGRPADTTVTLGYYIYNQAFQEFQLGYASAVSWILFLMIFAVTLVNWRYGSRTLNA